MLDPREVAQVTAERSAFHEKKDAEIRERRMEIVLRKRQQLKKASSLAPKTVRSKPGRKRIQLGKATTNKDQSVS